LIDKDSGQPIAASVLKFEIGTQSCTATTDASGKAACSIILDQIPGPYNVVASFAGSGVEQATQTSTPFTITKEETTLSYTGDTLIANKFNANMSGVLLEDGIVPISGRTVTFTLGTGATAQTCQGTTDNTGTAKCTISPVNQPLGHGVVSDSFAGDAFYLPSNANTTTLIFAFPDRGVFVIGDKNSSTGTNVTYWSSMWSRLNLLSGGASPDGFKGFASDPTTKPPSCGSTWDARPGDSGKPANTVPSYMGILVSSKIGKSGSTISGDIPQIVVITTDPGYGPNPGQPGTGTEIATFCKK
jgi:hypothetical protein